MPARITICALLLALAAPCACSSSDDSKPAARADDDEQTTESASEDDEPDDSTGKLDASATTRPDAGKGVDAGSRPAVVDASRATPDAAKPAADAQASDAEAGGDASDAGLAPDAASAASHFPRSAEAVSVAQRGPYTVKTYTQGLNDPAYSSSIMYYPEAAEAPFAAIAFSPGYTATKEDYSVLGQMFASHGFAVLMTTPTNTNADQPPARGQDLVAAVARLKLENERADSPLKGKIAFERVCITGQSMGGGGTLHAANELGDKIRCAVPLQPWQPNGRFPNITAPTLIIGAEDDTVAGVAQHAVPHYMSIPSSTDKTYAEFAGADHYLSTNRNMVMEEQAHYMVSFYKLHLEDDERYRPYLDGDKQLMSALSRYEYSKK